MNTTVENTIAPDSYETSPLIKTALPGPLASEVLARDHAVTSPSLPRAYPLVPKRGRGSSVEDVDGNVFLDFNAGIAVNSTGHGHPKVVAAVQRQAAEILHYSASDFYLPIYSEMCAALRDVAPMSGPTRVFLSNSGAEAVEGALKLARYATKRPYVISFQGAFHGRTMGALTLTDSKAKYHTGFGPLLPAVLHAPYADPRRAATGDRDTATIEYLRNALFRYEVEPTEVAAIFAEPIQGEGGIIVPAPGWMEDLRELCDEFGILLVADEVQSGIGRTGKMWAIEHTEVEPDIVTSAKGLASGLPLGAIIAREEIMTAWGPGKHGSTYGGSPVPCAAGLATLEVIRSENLLENSTNLGNYLIEGLRKLRANQPDTVRDVRGVGLFVGVEFPDGQVANAVQNRCFEKGLLVLEAGENVIRMSPPLVLTADEAGTGLRIFSEAVAEIAAGI
ncbi:acetyl ornithine aminotransferase family protein [Dactylosporangium fulvum]|uniref:Aminotransferase class III-fold pyridoxal phosphate-dependent enzyme n=1 Tax=Dactylosporangium fulvum TaxID=53359 RepID=A0ABY5W8L6_9ACTN|nr:aminotransferase class III-fold pyridoxal phosphate-dependent enzyme [Dactylosporangium fulvum]UWP85656.1 aminotransferase class III-fold pyridoxal phosphate-dependent enzyme [Dactylosporangium fulvum]